MHIDAHFQCRNWGCAHRSTVSNKSRPVKVEMTNNSNPQIAHARRIRVVEQRWKWWKLGNRRLTCRAISLSI